MGVPLYQCEQTYTFMAPQLKCVFQQSIYRFFSKESLKLRH